MRKNLKPILAITLAMGLSLMTFAGCGQQAATTTNEATVAAEGGVICLKVNPEIAIKYDDAGLVTAIEARNDDAKAILASYTSYEGKDCIAVTEELVKLLGEAGYFVEEVEGEVKQIVIEIESGSKLPTNTFVDDLTLAVRECVATNSWKSAIDVKGESDYGLTDYVDTDYGTGNDGVTDYDDTDYGPNNDGVTDYDDKTSNKTNTTNKTNNGSSDYNDTDYGTGSDGVTDYNDTDYGTGSDGATDYTPAPKPTPAPTPEPTPQPDYSDSGYDEDSGYGSDSGYDD